MASTVEQIAQACNITPRRVQQLAKDGVLPSEGRGQYNLGKCMAAYIRFLQRAVAAKGTMDDDGEITSSHHERNNLLRIQTERERLELAKAKGEVMAVADHEQILSSLIIETKARIMAVGPRVSPQLVGETSRVMIQAKIEVEHKAALMHLAERTPTLAPATTSVAPEPAPEPDREQNSTTKTKPAAIPRKKRKRRAKKKAAAATRARKPRPEPQPKAKTEAS